MKATTFTSLVKEELTRLEDQHEGGWDDEMLYAVKAYEKMADRFLAKKELTRKAYDEMQPLFERARAIAMNYRVD